MWLFFFLFLQFFDKFNIRHNIAELLEYLWDVPSHRNAWRQVSNFCCTHYSAITWYWNISHIFMWQIAKEEEKGVYLNFLNFLINDSIYLLDESLNKILELKEIEAEMANTIEWERRPAQEREERLRVFHQWENVSIVYQCSQFMGLLEPFLIDFLTYHVFSLSRLFDLTWSWPMRMLGCLHSLQNKFQHLYFSLKWYDHERYLCFCYYVIMTYWRVLP